MSNSRIFPEAIDAYVRQRLPAAPEDAPAFRDLRGKVSDVVKALDYLEDVNADGAWVTMPANVAVLVNAALADQTGTRFLQLHADEASSTWEAGVEAFACRIRVDWREAVLQPGLYSLRYDMLPADLAEEVSWSRPGRPLVLPALRSRGTCTLALRANAWVDVDARYIGGTYTIHPSLLVAAGHLARALRGSESWQVVVDERGGFRLLCEPQNDAISGLTVELMPVLDRPQGLVQPPVSDEIEVPKKFGGVAFPVEDVAELGFDSLVQRVALNLSRRVPGKRPLSVWAWIDTVFGVDGGFAGEVLILGLSSGHVGPMQALCAGVGIRSVHRETWYRDSDAGRLQPRAVLVQYATGEVVRVLATRRDGTVGYKDVVSGAFVTMAEGTETLTVDGSALVLDNRVVRVV
jgi:hypothetical protein